MKRKSIAPSTTGVPPIVARPTTIASVSSLLSRAPSSEAW